MSFSIELPQTYTFSLCIDRGGHTIVDTTVEVPDTRGGITRAKRTVQRLMNEYAPTPKAPEPAGLNPESQPPADLLPAAETAPTPPPEKKPEGARGLLTWQNEDAEEGGGYWEYMTAGKVVDTIRDDSVIMMALLHDICKTHFYGTSTRNVKVNGRWEQQPFYTVNDMMPLGHGPKSAMIVKQYTTLTSQEMYAIWHHMGMNGNYENDNAVGKSIEMYPAVLALQTADMMASRFMEGEKENLELFADVPAPASAGEWADNPATGEPTFEEAPALSEGA